MKATYQLLVIGAGPAGMAVAQTAARHGVEVAVVDEIASAADLVMGKATGIPAAIVRGLDLTGDGRVRDLVRPPGEDLFR